MGTLHRVSSRRTMNPGRSTLPLDSDSDRLEARQAGRS
jgi:hypothetical protein